MEKRGRTEIVASCCYPVEEGLKVTTMSPKIAKIRKTIIELAAATAGDDVGGKMNALAGEYGADLSRFRSEVHTEPTKCILCGLCIRRCTEVNWDSAIGFIGRGIHRNIVLLPEKTQSCPTCNYCRGICAAGRISSAFDPDPPFPHINDVRAGRK